MRLMGAALVVCRERSGGPELAHAEPGVRQNKAAAGVNSLCAGLIPTDGIAPGDQQRVTHLIKRV